MANKNKVRRTKRSGELKVEFTNLQKIGSTIDRLVKEGYLPLERGKAINESLPEIIKGSEYVLFNLGVRINIGLIFAFDLIPLPLGTISRDIWVLGNKIYYEIMRCQRYGTETNLYLL